MNSISGLFEIGFFWVRIFISGLCWRLSDFLSRWLRLKKAETERTKSFGILFHFIGYSEKYIAAVNFQILVILRAVCTKKEFLRKVFGSVSWYGFWVGWSIDHNDDHIGTGELFFTMMIWTWEHNNWFLIEFLNSSRLKLFVSFGFLLVFLHLISLIVHPKCKNIHLNIIRTLPEFFFGVKYLWIEFF